MSSAANSLQKAVFAALTGDAAILSLLGGARVYDAVPADVPFPYIVFGRTTLYDWSTGTETGTEQLLTLHVWSKTRGRKQCFEIMEAARLVLHDQPLTMVGHRLVNCRLEFSDVRYEADADVRHGMMRFRAVTEEG